jgi:glycerol-3-phosphate dehydrogenase (NAD(P)+)
MKIAVIGGGAWGTAISDLLARNGNEIILWAREEEVVEGINTQHENTVFLPQVKLSENLKATSELVDISDSKIIFVVTPAQFTAAVVRDLKIKTDTAIVICNKGIEISSLKLMSDVVGEIFPKNPLFAMSGPNFAIEVANNSPAVTSIAGSDKQVAEKVIQALQNDKFRPIYCADIIGAEIGGAIKNIIAIAVGMATALKATESAKAAIIAQGLKEMAMLTVKLGGKAETMLEPCGVGDLVLTCSSRQSRNMSLGFAIGEGQSFEEIQAKRQTVAEGAATAKALVELISKLGLQLEVCQKTYQILYENLPVEEILNL